MAKFTDIIQKESERSELVDFLKIYLHAEGKFLHAYDVSAWLMSRYAAADLQPKKHKTRQTTDGTFVFVGFPLTTMAPATTDIVCASLQNQNR